MGERVGGGKDGGEGGVREVGEGWRVGVVQGPPSRRRAGVGGAAEAVRGVVLGAACSTKLANLPRGARA